MCYIYNHDKNMVSNISQLLLLLLPEVNLKDKHISVFTTVQRRANNACSVCIADSAVYACVCVRV